MCANCKVCEYLHVSTRLLRMKTTPNQVSAFHRKITEECLCNIAENQITKNGRPFTSDRSYSVL